MDETLEHRLGKRIAAKGRNRDAVRSSKGYFVKVSGLRWACLVLLVPIPFVERTWVLPVLTALDPVDGRPRRRDPAVRAVLHGPSDLRRCAGARAVPTVSAPAFSRIHLRR